MFDVYIAGAMTGRSIWEVNAERAVAQALLCSMGLTFYDPSDDEGLELKDPDSLITNAFDQTKMKEYVSKDLAAVSNCRAVLNITGDLASDGTNWEMAYAVWQRRIPVHIVAPERLKGAKMSFTNILVDGIHSELYYACEAIRKKLQEENL